MWNDVFRGFDLSLSDAFDGFFPSMGFDSTRASQLTSLGDLLVWTFLKLENPVIRDLYCVLGSLLLGIVRLVGGGPCLCFGLCSWLYVRSES